MQIRLKSIWIVGLYWVASCKLQVTVTMVDAVLSLCFDQGWNYSELAAR
jgi:hypothetical protein